MIPTPGRPMRPFMEVWPRREDRDSLLVQLGGRQWYLSLGALILTTGRMIDKDRIRAGCYFGFCDAHGLMQPMRRPEATHVGWTLGGKRPG